MFLKGNRLWKSNSSATLVQENLPWQRNWASTTRSLSVIWIRSSSCQIGRCETQLLSSESWVTFWRNMTAGSLMATIATTCKTGVYKRPTLSSLWIFLFTLVSTALSSVTWPFVARQEPVWRRVVPNDWTGNFFGGSFIVDETRKSEQPTNLSAKPTPTRSSSYAIKAISIVFWHSYHKNTDNKQVVRIFFLSW